MRERYLASFLIVFIILTGEIGILGIKHAVTVSDGTKADPTTQWNADHIVNGNFAPTDDDLYSVGSGSLFWANVFATTAYIDTLYAKDTIAINIRGILARCKFDNLNASTFNLSPTTTNTGSLGKSDKLWADIWATNLHSNSGGAQFIWKDASETAYTGVVGADVAWTDLDLTAFTSANAKMVYLGLYIAPSVANKAYILDVRKNGTTPTAFPYASIYAEEVPAASMTRMVCVTVGMDTAQTIEYAIALTAGGSATFGIYVLGYWE